MHNRTAQTLLALGFDTNLIAKIGSHGHTVGGLKGLSQIALRRDYDENEVQLILKRIKRQPIRDEVLETVIEAADGVCCFCADGNRSRPYQIHHAVPYSKTQDSGEDNLILICPTHHQAIPIQFTAEQQKSARRRWHAIVQVARGYRARGLDFPFGLFVARDYRLPPNPVELIEGYGISNSTALDVSRHALAEEAVMRLSSDRFLAVAGESGSGKSTFAIGIAGHLAEAGSVVFSFEYPVAGLPFPLQYLLTFLSTVDRECVLLLDDANRQFSEGDLLQIERAKGTHSHVIATWTRDAAGEPRFERHLPGWFLLDWQQLRISVREYFLKNRAVMVRAIRARQDSRTVDRVGLGHMDIPVERYLSRYERDARTVSEFLFMIRGGKNEVSREIKALADWGRADIPIVFAAIEQIGGFEKAVTPSETAEHCAAEPDKPKLPRITPDWVQQVFESARKRGLMQEARQSYRIIHRDWAARLIAEALANPETSPETERMLVTSLNLSSPEPNRLMRLWTWLWYQPPAGQFVKKWLSEQKLDDWTALIGQASMHGLETLGTVASRMHILFQSPNWTSVVKNAFQLHETRISRLVRSTSPEGWYFLRELEMALSHAAPSLSSRIWEDWNPHVAASIIERTHPDFYDSVHWTFAGVKRHSPAWLESVGKALAWGRISEQLNLLAPGDLRSIFTLKSILSDLKVPIRRSMVRRLAELIGKTLAGSRLRDFHIGFPPFWDITWWVFSKDVEESLKVVDIETLANDLAIGSPREWRIFADLMIFKIPSIRELGRKVIDQVDLPTLGERVRSQATGYEYELRCLLFDLGNGSKARRSEIAAMIYPDVLAACTRSETERLMLASAFYILDSTFGERLLVDARINPGELKRKDKSDWGTVIPKIRKIQGRVNQLEESGSDFVIDFLEENKPSQ